MMVMMDVRHSYLVTGIRVTARDTFPLPGPLSFFSRQSKSEKAKLQDMKMTFCTDQNFLKVCVPCMQKTTASLHLLSKVLFVCVLCLTWWPNTQCLRMHLVSISQSGAKRGSTR